MDVNPEVLRFARRAIEGKAKQPVPRSQLSALRRDLRQGLQGRFIKPGVESSSPPVRTASNVLREEEILVAHHAKCGEQRERRIDREQ